MTSDQRFRRWVRGALLIAVFSFVYFLIADLWMPMTSQARVMHPVVSVASRVSGRIDEVLVHDNQHVEAGDVLFRIDAKPYQLAVQQAELALEAAIQANQQLDASILAAKAQLEQSRVSEEEQRLEMARVTRLIKSHSISRQQYDQTRASYQGAQATVRADQADLAALKVQRGLTGDDNLSLRQARNALEQARLDLAYTEVRAREAGTVSNMQLVAGAYASTGQARLAIVADRADVIADFREKSLSRVAIGDQASIIFDAQPGRVFAATLSSRDSGVQAGQLNADGYLAAPEDSDRWVRDAQRMRVHLVMPRAHGLSLSQLPTGSRATVQLFPVAGPASWLAHAQARAVSLLHYIY
ncbi:MAG: HlyD family secretion protein [Gammaproteobacteria bacterium]|uniref:HlyD family secretion protein n=1 Tax=Cobetia sp. TaxID=1873876 RepID=UPI001D48742E|nr:HlyD family secretion protein [Gammaproteobacteria bacterium]